MAGAITAALFLRRFVTASPRYLHIDIYGWTPQAKPARPKGGAFQAGTSAAGASGGDDFVHRPDALRRPADARAPRPRRRAPAAARSAPTVSCRGQPCRVTATLLDMTSVPDPDAERTTQLLHGEGFIVYETRTDGLAWGQATLDSYVGYVSARGPRAGAGAGPAGSPRSGRRSMRSPSARARVLRRAAVPGRGPGQGHDRRVLPAARTAATCRGRIWRPSPGDFVAQAERFIGVPYLWGGRSIRGIDCSGLVQLALIAGGRAAPRDSDMQAALVGTPSRAEVAPLVRGDLRVLAGACRDHARRRDAAARQRPSHGGGDRAAGVGDRADRRRRRRADVRAPAALRPLLHDPRRRAAHQAEADRSRPGRRGRARGRRAP